MKTSIFCFVLCCIIIIAAREGIFDDPPKKHYGREFDINEIREGAFNDSPKKYHGSDFGINEIREGAFDGEIYSPYVDISSYPPDNIYIRCYRKPGKLVKNGTVIKNIVRNKSN